MLCKLVPALTASLLLTTACATESDDAAVEVHTGLAAVATLRAAPDVVAETGTAAFEMVMAMSLDGHAIELVANGAYDTEAQRMSMSMELGDLYGQLANAENEALANGLDTVTRVVADGPTYYVRSPMLDALVGSADWLSFDAGDHGMAPDAVGIAAFDPSQLVEWLRGVAGEPSVVGPDDVRGVETTHYTATMDVGRTIAQAPADQRALIESQLDQLGDTEIAVDVWVDADGLPRRLRMDMGGLAPLGLGEEASAILTMEYFDYGQPVDIQLPSPDEVTPFSELLGGSFGNGS